MADENNAPAGAPPTDGSPQLALQALYMKDCSFEAPSGPRVEGNWNPQINLDLQTGVTSLGNDLHEILLTVTVSAKQSDKTVFLVEVKQAGVFLIQNLQNEDARRAIGTICPNVLFPYARASVSMLVTSGGFPQLLLPPVNFEALYASQAQNAAAGGEQTASVTKN